jgi:hypothetical protein
MDDGPVNFIERAIDWGMENLIIDPDLILEVGRGEEVYPVFESREEVKNQLDRWCYGTYWPKQPKRILVWYEKAALSSIIKPECNKYVVPSLACRGDNSDTQLRDKQRSPMLRATNLWERTSAKGETYLAGRLGGLRVLVMRNRDHDKEGDPTHVLLFTEAAPKQDRGEARRPAQQQRENGEERF